MSKNVGTYLFLFLILLLIASPLVTLLRGEPTFAVAVRTWSMEPALTRGDTVFILPSGEEYDYKAGQVAVFRSPEDGIREWTMHRIVGGDAEEGFITQGDANERTDQEGGYPPIQPEWIAGVVPTLGPLLLKAPLAGYIPILLEENMQNPLLLPGFLGILAIVLLLDELFKSRKRRKKESLQKSQLFFLGGLAFAVLMGAVMLMGSLFITFPYGVGDAEGALMGSDVGVLRQGEEKEVTLAELQNEGAIPSYYLVVSRDPQVKLHQEAYFLPAGDSDEIAATVHADEPGTHQASITVGMFLPFLPRSVTAYLAGISFWLALVAVALTPSVPLMVFPYLEPKCRRRVVKKWRKRFSFLR